ncbi:DUF1501 domain-containing protein [Thermomonas sp.]|jgi:uncharacterized protein (DUF1501 family)|uniref:DUF1501 domain-containing protein n=1 Tax=Thermomonas sp. TaxID=1971895 RepID=UPI0023902EA0|nr:DUF1501 domain-containing protein [Thermomonas sp.]MBS0460410.1 DUF1501 domain-containing protein [Pseudomonadota bacterium]MDE2381931.1 DUF1501 domain-containing protein [Xanthomonadaceae bacterium]HOC10635.1 DUF1501 domain-containing protein [Thermomonas sp.]HQA01406.1 DUF1501 domain-containing protein [Thermomonas sp.]
MNFDRRGFLGMSAASLALAALPKFALAAAGRGDTRFLLVLLRGGLDGLHALQAPGDPGFAALRGDFVNSKGQAPSLQLNVDFALHGALGFMAGLYAQQQLLPMVAVAPPYRQRSHFEAQDCVENGTTGTSGTTGWLNRCVAAMPGGKGLAISAVMPLAMRGKGDVSTWSPPLAKGVDPILWQQLQVLYAADPSLAPTFAGIDARMEAMGAGKSQNGLKLPQAMAAAAKFMAAANGPRIGFVEDTGWDSHGGELALLDRKLAELDAGVKAFHAGAESIWNNTVVVIVTEFGRTAAINGTGGTDHGTGGVAFVAGGAVKGGRIAGQWPGLGKTQLNEGRDLLATTDMRALFKGILREHLEVGSDALARSVFPDSAGLPSLPGLVRAG